MGQKVDASIFKFNVEERWTCRFWIVLLQNRSLATESESCFNVVVSEILTIEDDNIAWLEIELDWFGHHVTFDLTLMVIRMGTFAIETMRVVSGNRSCVLKNWNR